MPERPILQTEPTPSALIITGEGLQDLTPKALDRLRRDIRAAVTARLGGKAIEVTMGRDLMPDEVAPQRQSETEAAVVDPSTRFAQRLGRGLRGLRQLAQKSQAELAQDVGTPQAAVSDRELSKVEPLPSKAYRHAAACDHTLRVFAIPNPEVAAQDEPTATDND